MKGFFSSDWIWFRTAKYQNTFDFNRNSNKNPICFNKVIKATTFRKDNHFYLTKKIVYLENLKFKTYKYEDNLHFPFNVCFQHQY